VRILAQPASGDPSQEAFTAFIDLTKAVLDADKVALARPRHRGGDRRRVAAVTARAGSRARFDREGVVD
jgi:hypothetical protein